MAKLRTIIKARYLRKEETQTEKVLWEKIRNNKLGVKFRRQHPLDVFVIDFYAPSIGIAIELDGSFHRENKEYDRMRTDYLNSKNIKVIRFWNNEIEKDLEEVLNTIRKEIKELL
ncbi:MAG: endonuclease domain-containing protein [Patescibacteria group bacterium]